MADLFDFVHETLTVLVVGHISLLSLSSVYKIAS